MKFLPISKSMVRSLIESQFVVSYVDHRCEQLGLV